MKKMKKNDYWRNKNDKKHYLCGKLKIMQELALHEPAISYGSTDDHNLLSIIELVRQGISYSAFEKFASGFKFSLGEWARFLHVSERSIQRYKKEQKRFDSPQSEKLIEIVMLFKKGEDVFGSRAGFISWLESSNPALGGGAPVGFIDNTFGIGLVKDELTRIEHGVMA